MLTQLQNKAERQRNRERGLCQLRMCAHRAATASTVRPVPLRVLIPRGRGPQGSCPCVAVLPAPSLPLESRMIG